MRIWAVMQVGREIGQESFIPTKRDQAAPSPYQLRVSPGRTPGVELAGIHGALGVTALPCLTTNSGGCWVFFLIQPEGDGERKRRFQLCWNRGKA